MSKWKYGITNRANEEAGSGQGAIIKYQLTPKELAELNKKYPRPTGKAAERPFVIRGTIE